MLYVAFSTLANSPVSYALSNGPLESLDGFSTGWFSLRLYLSMGRALEPPSVRLYIPLSYLDGFPSGLQLRLSQIYGSASLSAFLTLSVAQDVLRALRKLSIRFEPMDPWRCCYGVRYVYARTTTILQSG